MASLAVARSELILGGQDSGKTARAVEDSSTTSGFRPTTRSTLKSATPPRCGSCVTDAGQLDQSSTPTSRSQAPSSQTVSVSDGS